MICATNVFCRNSDCILDAKLPCHILCIAHIVQALCAPNPDQPFLATGHLTYMWFFWPLYWIHIEMFTFMLMALMMMTTTMMMCCFWPLWWVHTLELCDPWQQKPNARVTVAKLKLIKQNKTFQRQKLRLKKHFKNKHKKIKESSAWAEIRLTFLFNCEYD